MAADARASRSELSRPGKARAGRRLIVNADDFGLSSSVNEAVAAAHDSGILTTASLMVNEPGFEQAVAMARERPRLGVGLHLTFLFGHSALPAERIPDLVNAKGEFSNSPALSGMKFFFKTGVRAQLREELRAQFARFRDTGLELDHVNGHLHLHLHPAVLTILLEEAQALGIQRMRLTRDPWSVSLRVQSGNWVYRVSHALIFGLMSARARRGFKRRGIRHTEHVFGLLSNAAVDEGYVERLLPLLPAGDSELYSHPSLHEFKHEYEALVSPRVRQAVSELGVQLIRYQDL